MGTSCEQSQKPILYGLLGFVVVTPVLSPPVVILIFYRQHRQLTSNSNKVRLPMKDYKLGDARALNFLFKWYHPRTACVRTIHRTFIKNMDRVHNLISFPNNLITIDSAIVRIQTIAYMRILGKPVLDSQDLSERKEDIEKANNFIKSAFDKWMSALFSSTNAMIENMAWVDNYLSHLLGDARPAPLSNNIPIPAEIKEVLDKHGENFQLSDLNSLAASFEMIFSVMLTSTWTAVETLLGDIWVATVNEHPKELARLSGHEKRTSDKSVLKTSDEPIGVSRQQRDKEITLQQIHDITKGEFVIDRVMGNLLRSKVSFASLWGIRRAYSVAFDIDKLDDRVFVAKLDSALSDKSFDILSSVRNMIVHHAGIADKEYEERAKTINSNGLVAPDLTKDQRLELDGGIVRAIIDPVMIQCAEIMKVIDEWLDVSPPPGYFPC